MHQRFQFAFVLFLQFKFLLFYFVSIEKFLLFQLNFFILVCGSGDSFVTAADPWLFSEGVDVVDMELFAIAYVASNHAIPWQSYKYITDDANENSGNDWQERAHHGQELFLQELKQLIS